MTTKITAMLAAAGLMSAGVAANAETRSSAAIPAAAMVGAGKSAAVPGLRKARQNAPVDCSLPANVALPQCTSPGRGVGRAAGAGGGGGVSGGVLAAVAAGLGGLGIAVAAKNDSNG